MKLKNYHKILAETPQEVKDAVDRWLDQLEVLSTEQVEAERNSAYEYFTINEG